MFFIVDGELRGFFIDNNFTQFLYFSDSGRLNPSLYLSSSNGVIFPEYFSYLIINIACIITAAATGYYSQNISATSS